MTLEPKKKFPLSIVVLAALALAAGCNLPRNTPKGDPSANDLVNTSAAQTVEVLSTQIALGEKPTLSRPGASTATRAPTSAAAVAPTLTHTPPPGSATPGAPSATPDPNKACNSAQFIRDLTIADGSTVLPGAWFTKTWEVKNTGSCAWDAAYSVVFANKGDAMSASSAPLAKKVNPGETGSISIKLRAPQTAGEYKGYWKLRSADGKEFGTGPSGASPFYVEINVGDSYNFAEHLCSAQWSSQSDDLRCPGSSADDGYAQLVDNPQFENGVEEDEPALLTVPNNNAGGFIAGRFEPVPISQEQDLRVTVACAAEAPQCSARVRIAYRAGENGAEQILTEWDESADGNLTQIVKDLDFLQGQQVAFTFYVYANGSAQDDRILWFAPRIVR